jgi:energy-coupling factor transporter ATP-binding protein EcfA2
MVTATTGALVSLLERLLQEPWDTVANLAERLGGWAAGWGLRLLLLAIPLCLSGMVATWGWRRWRQQRLAAGARLVDILTPPQVEPGAADALWSNLAGLLHQHRFPDPRPHVSFELRWTTTGVTVGLWVPGTIAPHLVERAVEAAWPGARASLHAATPPLPNEPGTRVVGGGLRLAGGPWQPLRTEHWVDPLRALLGAAGELAGGETAVVQVLARPAAGRRLARANRTARALAGAPGPRARLVGGLLDLLTPGSRRTPARPAGAGEALRMAEARAALAKLSGPCWEVQVRYGVAGPNRRDRQGRLRARAHALAAAFAVHTGRNRLGRQRLHRPAHTLAARPLHRGDLLSTGELAGLAHLPADPAIPGLARAGARPVPPPPGLPTNGKLLGDSELGTPHPVRLTPLDACQHVHLLGATGSGKSTLITNLALQDIHAGRGVVVVDPKGDLVTDLLDRLPEAAVERLVLLDPDERAAPPTLNPLDGDDPDLAVDQLVGILHRIWIAHWGPRIDDVLRASCLTLLRRPGATLTDIPRLLSDPMFRQPYLRGLDDPVGLGGFWAWYEQQSPAAQAQLVGPIMTRLRAFLLRGFVRDVVGAPTSSFDMAAVLDGGICLARVPKGLLGDDTARLLGSFVVARVWQAATARARTGQPLRAPASLYVDECQNFLTLPYRFEELLPEARGYGLALHLAHQHLGQLPRELHDALSANARTKVYFTCSPEDARLLERHVHPHLGAYDLAHLGAYQAAVRLLAGGSELPVCTIRTRPLPPTIPGRAVQARAAARTQFGRTRQQRRAEALRREYGGGGDPRLPGPIPLPPLDGQEPAS